MGFWDYALWVGITFAIINGVLLPIRDYRTRQRLRHQLLELPREAEDDRPAG